MSSCSLRRPKIDFLVPLIPGPLASVVVACWSRLSPSTGTHPFHDIPMAPGCALSMLRQAEAKPA